VAYFDKKVALVEEAPSYGGAVANTGVPGKAVRETALYLPGFRQRDLHGLTLAYDGTATVDRFMHRGRVRACPICTSTRHTTRWAESAAGTCMGWTVRSRPKSPNVRRRSASIVATGDNHFLTVF
jgi:pyruvate/2-oxoglutarate dehydrogenase complex dihydrolipoamide dehydrogenase (E3) component